MFETSVVQERVHGGARARVVTASIALHSFGMLAAIIASVAVISFPKHSPNQLALFRPVAVVTLPEPPRSTSVQPRQPVAAQHAATPRVLMPSTPIQPAPQSIPDRIPAVGLPSSASDVGPANPTGPIGPSTGCVNCIGTDPNAVGQPSNIEAGPTVYSPNIGEVKSAVVIRRVEPVYPPAMVRGHIPGVVKLLCIVDKQGNVQSAEVVSSTFGAFVEPAREAAMKWRFVPGSLHGRAVDTYFELTVTFSLR